MKFRTVPFAAAFIFITSTASAETLADYQKRDAAIKASIDQAFKAYRLGFDKAASGIKAPGAPIWAGKYSDIAGNHGHDITIWLSTSGFAMEYGLKSIEVWDQGYGPVTVLEPGRLLLENIGNNDRKILLLIPRDGLVFAVFEADMLNFLEYEGAGFAYREANESPRGAAPSSGLPIVPAAWKKYVKPRKPSAP